LKRLLESYLTLQWKFGCDLQTPARKEVVEMPKPSGILVTPTSVTNDSATALSVRKRKSVVFFNVADEETSSEDGTQVAPV